MFNTFSVKFANDKKSLIESPLAGAGGLTFAGAGKEK
jgi:hypothetical protein